MYLHLGELEEKPARKQSSQNSFMFFIQTSNIGEYRHFLILHFTLWNSPLSSNIGIWNRDKNFYRYFRDCYRYNFFKLKRSPTQNYVIWGALSGSHSAGAVPLFIWADLALEAIAPSSRLTPSAKTERGPLYTILHTHQTFFQSNHKDLSIPLFANRWQWTTKGDKICRLVTSWAQQYVGMGLPLGSASSFSPKI